jgi:HAE1 family hydrophobic/amphiphilic exporter-1
LVGRWPAQRCDGRHCAVIVLSVHHGFSRIATGFLPVEDQGYLLAAYLPDGASLARTQEDARKVTEIALKTPGVRHVISIAGLSAWTTARRSPTPASPTSFSRNGASEGQARACSPLHRLNKAMEEIEARISRRRRRSSIGNAAGVTMQLELRDKNCDLNKLRTVISSVEEMMRDNQHPAGDGAVPLKRPVRSKSMGEDRIVGTRSTRSLLR